MRWPALFIGLYLAVQILAPLEYYLHREDPHDERLAWRMFSPERMVRCRADVRVDGRPVLLGREFHQVWVESAARGKTEIVERMARHLCEEEPGRTVEVDLRCLSLGEEKPRQVLAVENACRAESVP